jgi:hypothetical protein
VVIFFIESVWSSLDWPRTMSERRLAKFHTVVRVRGLGALNEIPSLQITIVELDGSNYLAVCTLVNQNKGGWWTT